MTTKKPPKPFDLAQVTLDRGAHDNPNEGVCIMEAVAVLAGERFGDHPTCVSPVIGAYLRSWNDALEEEPRQRLKPYALKVLGTNTGPADDEIRAWMATDWLVRVQTPAWLELAGLKDEAAQLRNLPPLTSSEIAVACQSVIENARSKAAAAWDAARDAAWDAARDALKPCRCVVAAIVIGRRPRAWLRAKVGRWLNRGWTVGLVPIHEARARIRRCQHGVRRTAVQEHLAL